MLGPFSIDTYLPAFPQIQSSLNASALQVQQTLTAYMFAFSIMTLWHGAFSDAFGRRNIILVCLVVFGIATLGCAASHSIEYLWAFRILQGLSSGAGTVIGRAIVRDLYHGPQATRLLSLVTMIFSIGPGIAPILGGFIVKMVRLACHLPVFVRVCAGGVDLDLPLAARITTVCAAPAI